MSILTSPALVIDRFDTEYRWLSNYALTPVVFDGDTYPSAEHAFAAAKTLDAAARARIAVVDAPADAKRLGRSVVLRAEWDATVRYAAMREILAAKFSGALAEKLAGTGEALLVEGNTWCDQHWGDCTCPRHRERVGTNHLGRMLMALRAQLHAPRPGLDGAGRWHRVGVTGHRDLDPADQLWVRAELDRVLAKLRTAHGTRVLIDGMAIGADILAAEAALDADIRLWGYLPFPDQAARFPSEWAQRHELARARARRVVVLGDTPAAAGPLGRYVSLLHDRNRLIVRDADTMIAVHDRSKTTGGTVATIGHARSAGLKIITIDPATRTVSITPSSAGASAHPTR